MGKDGTVMIEFTPAELKIIFNEIQVGIGLIGIGHADGKLSLYESIEQKIAKELNIRTTDYEEI